MKKFWMALCLGLVSVFMVACEKEPETPGEKLEQGMEEMGEDLGDAVDDMAEGIEEAVEEVEE